MTPEQFLKANDIKPTEFLEQKVFSYSSTLALMKMYHQNEMINSNYE